MNKTFYLDQGGEKLLDRMVELNKDFNFSKWVILRLQEDVDRLTPKKNEPDLGRCHYPRWKVPRQCSIEVCPCLVSKGVGDGPIAIAREFKAKDKCIFRGS